MKLPLSEDDAMEISAAYKQAVFAAKECAKSLEALASTLEQRFACIDDSCNKQLDEAITGICSHTFKLRIAKCKIANTGFMGREFTGDLI